MPENEPECTAGNVCATLLQTGKTMSCGCLQTEAIREKLKLCDGTSVTILEATRNHLSKSNTSGYTGVYWSSNTQKWRAQITFRRKTYFLGAFDQIEDAIAARKRGEEMHESFLKWYYTQHPEKQIKGDVSHV